MKYVKPSITSFTNMELSDIIEAAACGSKPASCYGVKCNADGCTFIVKVS